MSLQERQNQRLEGNCPVCDSSIVPEEIVIESELINCATCFSMLVVDAVGSGRINLEEAPQIEEDWGE